MSIFLLLDTKDSLSGTPHDAVFNLSSFVKDAGFHFIRLKSITFLNGRYNIHSGNNVLVFQEDGVATDLNATLTPSNYSADELALELKAKMDAVGANTYTITYDDNTLKYTISTSGTSVKITSGSTCLKEIGFTAQTTFQAGSTISDLIVRLDGTQYVSIISGLPSANLVSNQYTNILARVPLTQPVGSLVHYEVAESTPLKFSAGTLSSLNMRLVDDKDQSYVLPNNCQIQYVLQLDAGDGV